MIYRDEKLINGKSHKWMKIMDRTNAKLVCFLNGTDASFLLINQNSYYKQINFLRLNIM
jgi:hypothetical protein